MIALYLAAAIALVGSLVAGIHDLLTTDIPDSVTNFMIISGIAIWYFHSIFSGTMLPLTLSLIVGFTFSVIGSVLYKTGNWGGGDGKLLAGIGFLLPFWPGIPLFSIKFFLNVFFIGGIYSLFYAIYLASKSKNFKSRFSERIEKHILLASAVSLAAAAITWFASPLMALSSFVIVLSMFVAWDFGKAVEESSFVREIPTSELKEGDVLADSKTWRGLEKHEVEKLKKRKGKIMIKEGVRFGPSFFLALVFTIVTRTMFGLV